MTLRELGWVLLTGSAGLALAGCLYDSYPAHSQDESQVFVINKLTGSVTLCRPQRVAADSDRWDLKCSVARGGLFAGTESSTPTFSEWKGRQEKQTQPASPSAGAADRGWGKVEVVK